MFGRYPRIRSLIDAKDTIDDGTEKDRLEEGETRDDDIHKNIILEKRNDIDPNPPIPYSTDITTVPLYPIINLR
jgi:hypothetical protein